MRLANRERIIRRLPSVLDELYTLTAELGSADKHKPYMERFVSPVYLDVARAIKQALDPDLILDPGKISDV